MSEAQRVDTFGKVRLGYALIGSRRRDPWRRFFGEGVGLHDATEGNGPLVFRMDEHARRLIVVPSDAEDLTALGYQVADQTALGVIIARLEAQGVPCQPVRGDEASLRGVDELVRVLGPKKLPIELFVKARTSDDPLHLGVSGFVTGELGLGHLAITSRRPAEMIRFWTEFFDARQSDTIEDRIGGVLLDFTFLRLNPRHHSIAVAAARLAPLDPIRTQAQHLAVQVRTYDDLTTTYRRIRALRLPVTRMMGQHPNDHATSFYVESPSGFDVEVGWEPLSVQEGSWQPGKRYQGISLWGHGPWARPPHARVLDNLGNLVRGAGSLLRPEYSPFDEARPRA
jgi:2,3-dihydroxybiphenyl 1,2-dioxygenase